MATQSILSMVGRGRGPETPEQRPVAVAPAPSASERRLRLVVESAPVSLCILDPEGKVLAANRAALTLLGVERLTNSSIGLRLTVKTAANKHPEVARELRRRVKLAFDQAGIKAPSREQLVLAGESKRVGEWESGRVGDKGQ